MISVSLQFIFHAKILNFDSKLIFEKKGFKAPDFAAIVNIATEILLLLMLSFLSTTFINK
jgi:hypothetical protein